MMDRILLVDDEPDLVAALAFTFEREGFETLSAHTGAAALAAARSEPRPHLVLLDQMLPDLPGTEVCRQLKMDPATQQLPVIMLTARSEESDRVAGLEAGADDYVPKPFSSRELVLRVRAVLRRSRPIETTENTDEFGILRVDTVGHKVWVSGEERVLTALEFRLLTAFFSRRGRAQSRQVLLDEVWSDGSSVTTRTVDTHVKRLRQKLGDAGAYIQTLRGVGYRFASSPDDVST